MARLLVLGSILWPLSLGTALWLRVEGHLPVVTAAIYAAVAPVCHRLDERSFHTGGMKWPVCARCSALYLAAPLGASAAARRRRRSGVRVSSRDLLWLAVAGLPTAVTLALEWFGLAPTTNLLRAVAAAPLGAMIAFVLVRAASDAADAIEYTDRA